MAAATGTYPGIGAPLYRASSNPQEPVHPNTQTIPTTASSMAFPLNGGEMTSLNVHFASAPSGTAFNIMYSDVPAMTDEYVLQAIPAVALQLLYTWSTGMLELDGFIRITNAGGVSIDRASIQQRAKV